MALEKCAYDCLEKSRNYTDDVKLKTLKEVKSMLDAKRNEIVTEMQKWTEISLNK
jgi:hypothetical protein